MFTQKYLNECFDYCRASGILKWKVRPINHFSSRAAADSNNARQAGKEAGSISKRGYKVVGLNGRRHYAHRLIFILVNGDLSGEIDHIDGDKTNNRIGNLRQVSRQENARNIPIKNNNKTGIPGVRRSGLGYAVSIGDTSNGYLGTFYDFFEACCARKAGEIKHGYHKNHGRV